MPKILLTPEGYVVSHIALQANDSADIALDNEGRLTDFEHVDSPDFQALETPAGDKFVYDFDGSEFLVRHCRVVDAYDGFNDDVWSQTQTAPWPADVVAACHRIVGLSNALVCVKQLRQWTPNDWEDDTIKAVIDNIIIGRTQAEIDTLEERIAAYRKANPDITEIKDPEDEDDEETDDA
jgi:hypothetical protein